ncbi:MAG: serine/threonine-protein kinase [Planctomycetota bacterium]
MDGEEKEPISEAIKTKVRELVSECLELMPAQGESAIAAICARHPELAPLVKQRLAALHRAGLLEEPRAADALPEQLGDFRLLKRLGGGGMGVVYLAEQVSLRRQVALKVVRPELLYFAGARERFRREVEAISRLQHENVVPVYSVGEELGIPYFAMQLLEGATLAQIIDALARLRPQALSGKDVWQVLLRKSGKQPQAGEPPPELFRAGWVEFCCECAHAVALALAHAHDKGVLHRDLKPSNILVTESGRVLLFDFGLAASEGTSKLTRTGAVLGSVPYMSPEQCRGSEVDERSDVYSLGVTLYELLTLRSPFLHQTPELTQRRILDGQPASLSLLNPAVRWDVETVCLTAIDVERERRYSSAADLAKDLRRLLEHQPITARRPGAVLRLRRFAERHPAWTVGMVLGLLLCVGSVAFAVWQKASNLAIGDAYHQAQVERAAALRQKEIADRERERATEGEQQARANLETARRAVQQMLAHVGEVVLMNVPQMEQIRRKLLEDSIGFYQRLVTDSGMDPEVRFELAQNIHRLGRVQTELGTHEQANHTLRQAQSSIAQLEGAIDAQRLEPEATLVLNDLAGSEWALGRTNEAEQLYRTALERYETLAAAKPSRQIRYRQSDILVNLGAICGEADRLEEAAEHLRRARDLAADLCAQSPESLEYQEQKAVATLNLGSTLARAEDPDAEPTYLEAKAELERLVARVPSVVSMRTSLVTACGALGLLHASSEPAEAIAHFDQAVQVATRLAADFPTQSEFAIETARWLVALARACRRSGDHARAHEALARAGTLLDTAQARAPSSIEARARRSELDYASGEQLAHDGQIEAAAQAYERAEKQAALLAQQFPTNAAFGEQAAAARHARQALASTPHEGEK